MAEDKGPSPNSRREQAVTEPTPLRSSLTTRVVAVLVLATVLPTLTVGILAIQRARNDLEREVVRGNLALIRALGASLDTRLQGARRVIELSAASWADERTADTRGDDAGAERLLRRLRRETPFAQLSIVDVNGGWLHGDRVDVDPDTGAHSFGSYLGDVTFVDDRPRVQIVAQARSRTGELAGVFVAQLDLQFIADALAEARLGRGARLMVIDATGVPVARSDGRVVATTSSLRGDNPAVDRALGSAVEGSLHDRGIVAVYRNLSGFQGMRGISWSIILEQPEREAYALARATTQDTAMAGFVALAIALVVGVALATGLTTPLRRLARRADAIAGDETSHSAMPIDPGEPIRGPGEIGALARRIEIMAERIGERERLQSALARGDRLASVGTMAASVAHEINNPLTTVLGYAKLMREDKGDDHPDRRKLDLIAEEAERMKTIIGSLLDYSRAEAAPASAEPADVNGLLRRAAALMAHASERRNVHVELDLDDTVHDAAGEAYALQQVFLNIVQNAIQALPSGGILQLSSELSKDGIFVLVTFDDNGPGVPAEARERIFDPFYTTKAEGSGTGLGLAVCRHLLTRMGGTIEVGDAPAGGARFVVRVPVVEEYAKAPADLVTAAGDD